MSRGPGTGVSCPTTQTRREIRREVVGRKAQSVPPIFIEQMNSACDAFFSARGIPASSLYRLDYAKGDQP